MCSFKPAFWLDYATGPSGWKAAGSKYISPRSKEAMLLTNWVRTGFDDLIWRSLSADPTDRPLPSEILTSLWFTNESLVLEEGSTLEFTCPYMETPPGIVSLFFSLLVFLCMGIATVVLGLHEIIVKIKAGQSMSPYVWEPVGGIYIICSSLCVMAWLDYGLIYWVIMAPLGLFTILGSTLEIFKDWQSLDAFQGLHLAKRSTSHQSRGFCLGVLLFSACHAHTQVGPQDNHPQTSQALGTIVQKIREAQSRIWQSECIHDVTTHYVWSNYSDLTRPGPPKGS